RVVALRLRRLGALPDRESDVRGDRELKAARRVHAHPPAESHGVRMKGTLRTAMAVLLLAGCASAGGRTDTRDGAYDIVILNGRIVDGTGAAWFYGDIGIRGDRIARLARRGSLAPANARDRIAANATVSSPAVIDIQCHSRGNFLAAGDGRMVSKITQGVTTEIMGEGSTNAI